MSSIASSGQETIAVRHATRPPVPPTAPAAAPVPPAIFAQVRVDTDSLAQSRANALIIGDQLAVMRVLGIIWPTLKKSVRWVESTRLSLPLESGGTLILEEADRLSERDQTDLLGWLDEHGLSVRVVTTSSRPLFPLVEAGSFLDSLYYRLNHVVIAAHSDQALSMLADADQRERAILGAIGYSPNAVYLHRDVGLMPKRRSAWASWNFLRWQREGTVENDVAVTYWMNNLQGINSDKSLCVSLNPPLEPAAGLTFGKYMCEHPQYNAAAFAAQKRLGEIQGRRHTWFCGAWTGYGFHEDGLRSALAVAESLGAVAPWREPPPELAEAAE